MKKNQLVGALTGHDVRSRSARAAVYGKRGGICVSLLGAAASLVRSFGSALIAIVVTAIAWAQAGSGNYTVRLTATVDEGTSSVTLNWLPGSDQAQNYEIYRKTPSATTWTPIRTGANALSGTTFSYTETISQGTLYEYRVDKIASGYRGYGYITTGIKVPLTHSRGKLILVVEQDAANALTTELQRLERDLIGDGWTVVRPTNPVSRTDTAYNVKENVIRPLYNQDPSNTKALFLFGRVPVPYSGTYAGGAPDGHNDPGDDHRGAWPADVYYAEMTDTWTDTASYTASVMLRNRNSPGDGKFDTSYLQSELEMQVGRVDLSSLPVAGSTEIELLRNYLNKDHAFRRGQKNVQQKGLIADNGDGASGEAFNATGFRSFTAMFGNNGIDWANSHSSAADADRWISKVSSPSSAYLWTIGTNSGANDAVNYLGTHGAYKAVFSSDLITQDTKAVFYLFFGSWMGDWDQSNNILRTALATQTYGLASAWCTRPHLVFHQMAMGETLGYSMKASQDNNGTYENQIDRHRRGVHVALHGDPTLRLHPMAPVPSLNGSANGGTVALAWTASGDAAAGYHVYRSPSPNGPFTLLTTSAPWQSLSYNDTPGNGTWTYMVRAVRLEQSASGTYYNASVGEFVNVAVGSGGDTTPPTAQSLNITSSTSSTLTYHLTFSESVTGVDSSDFTVAVTGGAAGSVGSVSGSGSTYTIGVNFSGSSGTVQLNLKSSGTGIVDAANNPLSGGFSGQTHTINGGGGGWTGADIGISGGSHNQGPPFTVTGAGSDIYGNADEFRFVYQTTSGNFTIEAQVDSISNTHSWAKAGVMVRESTAPGARNAFMLVNPSAIAVLQWRDVANGQTHSGSGAWLWGVVRVKLQRTGDTLTGYYSIDNGATWTQSGTATISGLSNTVLVGLAVTSHVSGTNATGTFSAININPPPGGNPPAWTGTDVNITGGSHNVGPPFTVSGAGADIYGNTDEFRFVHQTRTGNFTIEAQVDSITNTHAWAKTGVMVRESTAAGARNAFMLVNPSAIAVLQWRNVANDQTYTGSAAWLWGAVRVKLQRNGDTLTGYCSTDNGATWTLLDTTTISGLSSTVLVGLAVTSHVSGTNATGTFSAVSITP